MSIPKLSEFELKILKLRTVDCKSVYEIAEMFDMDVDEVKRLIRDILSRFESVTDVIRTLAVHGLIPRYAIKVSEERRREILEMGWRLLQKDFIERRQSKSKDVIG